ncbi:MAG TPA: acyltransferase [Noviherbaspirillum sp.]|nr:acyltransferase [Noviherbaspirillum sp.]
MSAPHFRVLDVLKAIACNLIVLHHLAYYGPMVDTAYPLMPEVFDWLGDQGRIAVHIFLTIGGFLAAGSLLRGRAAATAPLRALVRRYAKLVPPFMAAMALAVAASLVAAQWMTHDSISSMPTAGQVAAHALLMHSILDYESLSAGAWYVAIDFQLFAMMTCLLWLAGRRGMPRWSAPVMVAGFAAASLMVFNLDSLLDAWAPYFFGSYGLGALAWWACRPSRRPIGVALLLGTILLLGGLALEMEFRSRLAVALGTAILVVLACRNLVRVPGQDWPVFAFLGRISYAIFLVHFPVCLVVNAAFTRFVPALPELQVGGMLFAWLASIAAGAVFHRWVEVPLAGWTDARLNRLEGRAETNVAAAG